MKTTGNTVLVTGGTSGIGLSLASRLLRTGNTVIITGRSDARLAATRLELPGVHTFVCDQADPEAISRLCIDATLAFPTLNMLINNAGVGLKRNLNDATIPLGDLEGEIRTTMIGPIQLVHALLPHLKQQEEALIMNVTSGLAFVPLAVKPIYSATKAAMHAYTQSLRAQLAQSRVRIVELAPPATKTNFNKGQEEMKAGPRMEADAVAQAALRAMQKGGDEVLPGLSKMLRLAGRVRPHAVLRGAEAARMSD